MDDDPILRELGAELARNDPELAALLSGSPPLRRRHLTLWLLGLAAVVAGVVVEPVVTLGVLAMLMVLAAPLLAVLWCALPGDGPAPRST